VFAQGLFLKGYLQPAGKTEEKDVTPVRPLQPADFASTSPFWAMFKREWLLLLRTPIWMFNVVGGMLVPFIIFPAMLLTGGEALTELRGLLLENALAQNITVIILGAIALFISRDHVNRRFCPVARG